MNRLVTFIVGFVFILFGGGPVLAALVDCGLWFVGSDARLVPWSEAKALFVVFWTLIAGWWLFFNGVLALSEVFP